MKIKNFFLFLIFLSLNGNSFPASSVLPNSSPSYIQELSSRLLKWQETHTPFTKKMSNLEKRYFDLCINELKNWDTLLSPKHSLQHFSISYKVESGKKAKPSVFCSPSSLSSKIMNPIKLLSKKTSLEKKDVRFCGFQWTDGSDSSAANLSSFWLENKTLSKDSNMVFFDKAKIFQLNNNQQKLTYTPSISPDVLALEGKSFSKAVLSTFTINRLDKKYFGYRLKDYQGPNVFNSETEEIIRQITSEFGLLLRYFNYEDSQNYEVFFP